MALDRAHKMAEQGISDETSRATDLQSGAAPLEESVLPMHIPRQPAMAVARKTAVQAQAWALSELLGQEKLIENVTIDSSTSKIWSFWHTWENVGEMHFRTLSKLFRITSWNLHFRFQFRSNFQQVGQIIVYQHNIPWGTAKYTHVNKLGTDQDFPFADDYRTVTMLSHTKVPMGEDVDVIIHMDWNLPVTGEVRGIRHAYSDSNNVPTDPTAYSTKQPTMGFVGVIAPFKMEIATGVSPQMSLRVWSHLTDVTFGGYSPDDSLL